jgi:hypothetical protein
MTKLGLMDREIKHGAIRNNQANKKAKEKYTSYFAFQIMGR